jgi:Fe(II)/alpha-ketoglutarate-dependent arginine beta-hydroxylase
MPTIEKTPTTQAETGTQGDGFHRLSLTGEEVEQIRSLLSDLRARWQSVEDADFHNQATLFAHQLPLRVRRHLNDFRLLEPEGICLISGWPVDQDRIGPTPPHWRNKPTPSPALDEEMLLVLFGSLLGDAIGWSTQQDGYVVHDIFPIQGHENEQLGSGSEELLWWHVEDAFHPYRGDYIGLMCLRNPDRVATTVLPISKLDLRPEVAEPLFREVFTIRPDESHLKKNNSRQRTEDPYLARSYERIERMNTRPPKIGVLFGDPEQPYMRLDPFFMDPSDDEEAWQTFLRLQKEIDQKLEDAVLAPGDFIFIDNFRAVHGRKPFKARYDGSDRWLKRINVTRDLRRSRDARRGPDHRVIL